MGYTHYWSFDFKAGKTSDLETKYQQAILECSKLVYKYSQRHGGIAGFSAHAKPGLYGGLALNGSRESGAEWFCLREHFKENEKTGFCKTNREHYDMLVTACLSILKYRLDTAIHISSDGNLENWKYGVLLAQQSLRRKVNCPIEGQKNQTRTLTNSARIVS
jgi:hypothetical protein